MQNILELCNITKEYPGVTALAGVDVAFAKGEVHAICGENGAGKSTLIKIITGAIRPSSGTIRYNGQVVTHNDPVASKAAGISCIYQEFNLIPYLTVTENVFFGREVTSRGFLDRTEMRRRTRIAIDQLGVQISPDARVRELSVGYQQIVEIAKAVAHNVHVLLMDEPSAPLTNAEIEHLFRIVRSLRQTGVTILYISHRLEEVFELSDRVTVLRDGHHVATKLTKDTDRNDLISMMVGRKLGSEYPQRTTPPGELALKVKNVVSDKLHGVSLDVRRHEILGLAGLVGAGRTETARAIFGADAVSSISIEVNGEPVRISSPRAAIDLGIGYIPEDRKQHGILALLSVRENMSFGSLRRFVSGLFIDRNSEREHVSEMRKKLRIKTPNLRVLVSTLSGGNQQKVVLSRTLLNESEILIFDEPTRGIDVGAKQEIYALMNELAESGKALIMISSEMPELIGMSDRIIVLSEGRCTGELQRPDFSQEKILEYASAGGSE